MATDEPTFAVNIPTAVAFFEQFYEGTSHNIELRSLQRNDDEDPGPRLFSRDSKKIAKYLTENANLTLYFGVATREGTRTGEKKDCRELPAFFTDIDFKVVGEAGARQLLAQFPLQPSLIIHSGGGFHVYWLFKTPAEVQNRKLEAVLGGLVKRLSADRHCAQIACVLRPPGTLNWKYTPPREVTIVQADWDRRYDLADFSQFEIEEKEETAVASRNGNGKLVPVGERYNFLLARAGEYRRKGDSEEVARQKILLDFELSCEKSPEDGKRGLKETKKMVEQVWDAYPSVETPAELKPTIEIKEGCYPQAADEAEQILLHHAQEKRIFQRAGEIVKVIALPEARNAGRVRRPAGTVMLEPMTAPALMETLERMIDFRKLKFSRKKSATEEDAKPKKVRCNCPCKIAAAYLSRRGEWRLPVLTGTIFAPLVRPDGSVLSAPGYDEATGLFLVSEEQWPDIPEKPELEDAREALEVLRKPFEEFPWAAGDEDDGKNNANRAVVIAAILTALERRILGPCPLFGFSAPAPRTGKSLLAESAAIIAIGRPAPASAVSPNKEELRKSLTAVLREGHAIINLDNIEEPLKSSDLCKIITQEEFSDRLLGESATVRVPTNVLWTATGNNLTFRGDLAQRSLLCRIESEKEHPEENVFKISDLKTYLLEHRAKLVVAALTILRAFYVAKKPKQDVLAWGGFNQWSDTVRQALIWAGETDPCLTRKLVIDDDPEKQATAEALEQLFAFFSDKTFTLRKAVSEAESIPDLKSALAEVTDGKLPIDMKKLGVWARAVQRRIVEGYRLIKYAKRKWKIEEVGKQQREPGDDTESEENEKDEQVPF